MSPPLFHPIRWEPRLYPGELARARRVRSDIRTDLKGFAEEVVGEVELCCSELFANAVLYTASGEEHGEVTRRLCLREPGTLRLEVVDGGWTATVPATPATRGEDEWLTAEGQRGLLLVHALAAAWGYYQVLPHPALNLGLGVWADFAVAPDAVPPGLDHFIFTT
ncbi:ATP-binding protein [Allosalinactinospora lopnorensis]|uniref:ATP-binding protein n=1 Tax=Allosalinactinospora lopnorensis TaxID=1352348 RepID=UPI000B1E50A1|nr:ATP-binding protein [Allosalinactinospora lopnorensis]